MRKFHLIAPVRALLFVVASIALSYSSDILADATNISPADAIHFVGQVVTVCGHVASARYASDSKGQPTFLNLDKPYPNHVFTAVNWGQGPKRVFLRTGIPGGPTNMRVRHRTIVPGKSGDRGLRARSGENG
jgi:hypothetical protein